jgi:hypothetical protein
MLQLLRETHFDLTLPHLHHIRTCLLRLHLRTAHIDSVCRVVSALRADRAALCQHAHMQALDIESLRSDVSGYQRECEVMSEHYADSLKRARTAVNKELATVRCEMNDAKLSAVKSAALQRQAEQDVRPLLLLCLLPLGRC